MHIQAKKGDCVIYINNHRIDLPALFENGFQQEDKYIVLLDDKYSKANIFAFDINGRQIWQVQENTFQHITKGYELIYPGKSDIFTAVILETWYSINLNTGKLILSYGDHQKTIYYNPPKKSCWLLKFFIKNCDSFNRFFNGYIMNIKKTFDRILNKQNINEVVLIDGQDGLSQIYINNHLVVLPSPYVAGVVKDNLAIILVDRESSGANIFAYDKNGNFVWKVQQHTFTMEKPGYEALEIYKGHLQAYCRDAWFKIDPKTGVLISEDSDRRGLIIYGKQ